jgi:hypothetical protein
MVNALKQMLLLDTLLDTFNNSNIFNTVDGNGETFGCGYLDPRIDH